MRTLQEVLGEVVTLGARIKEERNRLGMNQTEFAALAGASRRAMVNWESDGAAPLSSALVEWAKAGADALYILTGRRTPEIDGSPDKQVLDELNEIRRNIIEPARQRMPGEKEADTEARVLKACESQLLAILRYDAQLVTPDIVAETEHLLDIVSNPASLALYRAADLAQMRAKRREMRERLAGWFDRSRYEPGEAVLQAMSTIVMEYAVPTKLVIELVQDIYDDVNNQRGMNLG